MSGFLDKNFVAGNMSERRKSIADICRDSPMFDVKISKIHKRHLEDQNGHWLADFATQSYLGFDFRPEVIEAVRQGTESYGAVVPWCRLVATVDVFTKAEDEIAKLVGSEACNIFASTTLLNHGTIPALAGKDGVIFLDKAGHATMYEGAKIARDSGAKLVSFPTHDLDALESSLKEHVSNPRKIILTDGVFSMTGDFSELKELDALAKKYDALLFVDDAHGFGVVGAGTSTAHPYGLTGNGLSAHMGIDFENSVYVGCFSKAYGSFGSFICCSKRMKEFLISQATPHDLGGHGPASAMSAVLKGLELNRSEGDVLRARMHSLTQRAITGLRGLGYRVDNTTGFPIISVWLGRSEDIIEISKRLYADHILLTLSPYPMVSKGREALRITVTATNTEAEIDQLIAAFANLRGYLDDKGYSFDAG